MNLVMAPGPRNVSILKTKKNQNQNKTSSGRRNPSLSPFYFLVHKVRPSFILPEDFLHSEKFSFNIIFRFCLHI